MAKEVSACGLQEKGDLGIYVLKLKLQILIWLQDLKKFLVELFLLQKEEKKTGNIPLFGNKLGTRLGRRSNK